MNKNEKNNVILGLATQEPRQGACDAAPKANSAESLYTVMPDLIGHLSRIHLLSLRGAAGDVAIPRVKALSSRGRAESSDVVISCDKVLMNIRNHYCMSHLFSEIATSAFRLLAMTIPTLILAAILSIGTISESWAEIVGCDAPDTNCQTCGEGCYWSYDTETKELTLSGNGTMMDFEPGSGGAVNVPWRPYISQIKSVNVASGSSLHNVGQSAFLYAFSLKSFNMPNVTSVGNWAFEGTPSLEYFSWPVDENGNRKSVTIGSAMYDSPLFSSCSSGGSCNICTDSSRPGHDSAKSVYKPSDSSGTTGTCVSANDCGTGYTASNGLCNKNSSGSQVSESSCYANGQVYWDNACVDEYPFAKKHWTPAEAAQYLKDTDNEIIMTFKVNR